MSTKVSAQRGGKDVQVKVRNVARTMTTATLLATLPRGSRVLGIMLSGSASNATTTATLSFGTTTAANQIVNAANVLAAGQGNGVNLLAGVAGGAGVYTRANAATPIYVKYAETGTASTLGSWVAYIMYTTGNFEDDDTQ
jgi:hypothetical protein